LPGTARSIFTDLEEIMTKVLIADACKPSLVMSSEVFKDKIPGALVLVAQTGAQMLQMAQTEKPDICLVDFDLPDADGPSLIVALREVYKGPILLTAFPDNVVSQAVNELLFAYSDASAWIPKPVRFEELAARIERFLIEKRRTGKRFVSDLATKVIAKAAGRGKRAPKVDGRCVNISMGGACIALDDSMRMKKSQELTISIAFPVEGSAPVIMAAKPATKKPAEKPSAKKEKNSRERQTLAPKVKTAETKFKGVVAWITDDQVGIRFEKLSDIQKKGLESYLRAYSPAELTQ
jgi:DNA-binding response OmpR family regulator